MAVFDSWQTWLRAKLRRTIANSASSFGYKHGTAGTVDFTTATVGNRRFILEIAVYADGSDATLAINGGDSITVKSGVGQSWDLKGQLWNASLVFGGGARYTVTYLDEA